MIHHISIAVSHPLHVAKVLAEIWNGRCFPFPSHPGSYIVLANDEYGSAIEIYPLGTKILPGFDKQDCSFSQNPGYSEFSATHIAISVPTSQKQIEQIAAREGWRVVRCRRGDFFDVIEFWLENRVMLELLPPAIAHQYNKFMHPDNWEQFAGNSQNQPPVITQKTPVATGTTA